MKPSFRKYPSNTPGKHEIKVSQKTTHTSKSVTVEVQNVYDVKYHYMYHNCNHRVAATIHTLETLVLGVQL